MDRLLQACLPVAAISLLLASMSAPAHAGVHADASVGLGVGLLHHGAGAGLVLDVEAGADWVLDVRASAVIGAHRAHVCPGGAESCYGEALPKAVLPAITLAGQAAWPAQLPRDWTLGPAGTVRVATRGDREVYCYETGTCSTRGDGGPYFWPSPGAGVTARWGSWESGQHALEFFLGGELWSSTDVVFLGPQVFVAWRWPSGFEVSARGNSVEALLGVGWEFGVESGTER